MIRAGLNEFASRVKSDGLSVLVFNPLSWTRTGEVEVDVQFPSGVEHFRLQDSDGPVPFEILSSNHDNNWLRLRLLATNVPATGYKLITVVLNQAVMYGNLGRQAECSRHR